jgi:hypothetical protein
MPKFNRLHTNLMMVRAAKHLMQEELANVGVIEGARSALAALHHVLEHLLRHDTRQLPQIWNGIEMILDATQALPIERFWLVQLQKQFLFYITIIPSC